MQAKKTKGVTVAPTPTQGKTHQKDQSVVAPPVAPKTVTDHQHGSTGKPVGSATKGR